MLSVIRRAISKIPLSIRIKTASEEVMSLSSSSSSPTSPAPELYDIQVITQNDSTAVIDHLRKFFFKDEPLNVAVNLLDQNLTCEELETYSVKSIHEGTSLMAITNSNEIIAVSLNSTIKSDDRSGTDNEPSENTKFSKVKNFLDYYGREGTKEIAKRYPDVEKIMFVKIMSTDVAWRGKGIAKELVDRTRKMGKLHGYGLMRVDCSSEFSARAVAKLGFECIYEVKYEDYKENDQPVFITKSPHTAFKIYVQKIC
ncbi:hypothetical protein FQA39_LY00597 [Lamprigera yunnana]|nr:hypothetical protein FQA39_LY00597 [Lamprigera yunnana]